MRYGPAMLIRSLIALSFVSVALLGGCGDDAPVASTPGVVAPVASTPAVEALASTPAVQEQKTEKKKKPRGDAPEWVDTVNERCQAYRKQSTEVLNEFQKAGSTSPEAAADAMSQVLPLGKQLIVDLRPVEVPGEVEEDWTTFLDTLEGAFDLMPQLAKSISAGQPDPELVKQFAAVEKNTRPFADKYGLTECLAS